MKFELKPLVDNPLTEEEQTQLDGFFEKLRVDPDQKIVVTLAEGEKVALAKKKLAFAAAQKDVTLQIRRSGNQLIALLDQSRTKSTRIRSDEAIARVLTFLEDQIEPLKKAEIAAGTGLTTRQAGKALAALQQKSRVHVSGERTQATFTLAAKGDIDEPEKDRVL